MSKHTPSPFEKKTHHLLRQRTSTSSCSESGTGGITGSWSLRLSDLWVLNKLAIFPSYSHHLTVGSHLFSAENEQSNLLEKENKDRLAGTELGCEGEGRVWKSRWDLVRTERKDTGGREEGPATEPHRSLATSLTARCPRCSCSCLCDLRPLTHADTCVLQDRLPLEWI